MTIYLRCDDHIPRRDRTIHRRTVGKRGHLAPVPFLPFRIYRSELGAGGKITFRETVRSFSRKGVFAVRGTLTGPLVVMLQKIVHGRSRSSNWAGYSYIDEMRSEALGHVVLNALMFDAANKLFTDASGPTGRQLNPLAYLTSVINHSFLKVLRAEKKQASIRHDLRQTYGQKPSMGRQHEKTAPA